jgi:hypothetical protein
MASFMKMLRSRADSNRCTSFCRALPSHSATRPDWGAKLQRFPGKQGIFFQKGHTHCVNIPINGRIQFANLDFRADYSGVLAKNSLRYSVCDGFEQFGTLGHFFTDNDAQCDVVNGVHQLVTQRRVGQVRPDRHVNSVLRANDSLFFQAAVVGILALGFEVNTLQGHLTKEKSRLDRYGVQRLLDRLTA